jgi:hypothetical protein
MRAEVFPQWEKLKQQAESHPCHLQQNNNAADSRRAAAAPGRLNVTFKRGMGGIYACA